MVIEEIRLANLTELVAEFGTIANVAKMADTAPNYLSEILNRSPSRTGKPRDMGSDLARKIEHGCGKPRGWMDQDHSANHMPPADIAFINEVREDVAKYEVPDHIRQAVLTLLTSSPKKE